MKKLLILILTALFVLPTTAQHYRHMEGNDRYYRAGQGNYFGLRLGLNIASISSGNLDLDADSYAGLFLGGVYGIQLSYRAPLWLELGLAYSEKGGVNRVDGYNVKYRLGYMQIPIVCKYNIDISGFRIQPFLGGFLSVGVSGKTKNYHTRVSQSTYNTFKRFDGGLRLGCGAEYQMIYLEAGIDISLANISKDDFDTAHSRCIFINAGVNF